MPLRLGRKLLPRGGGYSKWRSDGGNGLEFSVTRREETRRAKETHERAQSRTEDGHPGIGETEREREREGERKKRKERGVFLAVTHCC